MRVAVTLIGRQVSRMRATPRAGAVIATFRRSLYIRDAAGDIACFGVPGLGAGPLNALCDRWPDEPIAAGAPTRWDGGTLHIGSRSFDFGAAVPWRPEPVAAAHDLHAALARLADIVTGTVPARGLGRTIGALVNGAAWTAGDPFELAGGGGVMALAQWLAAPQGDPPAAVARLIGLGPGLTPSGDDALGGAMIALRGRGRADLADRLAGWVLARAKAATSDISYAHLAAAAEGEGAAALHDTLAALARGDADGLVAGLRRLDAIGHSSGWDALAGAGAALVALARG